MKKLACLFLLLAFACEDEVSAPPAPPVFKPFRAEGAWLRDAEGRAVFLRGVNYSHRSKTKPFTSWMKASHFDRIKALGFNSVRLLLIWEAIEPKPGLYDLAYLKKMAEVVKWCEERGLWVVLDFHQDLWARPFGGDGAPAWATIDDLVEPNLIMDPWSLGYATEEVMANFDRFWTSEKLQASFRLHVELRSRAR